MQKSELIYEARSSFDKIASDCPDHSRTDIDSPAFKTYNENIKYPEVFPCLKEYKHLIYKEKLNNPIYNSKGYSSENEENDYCFANDNDNNENTTEEKNQRVVMLKKMLPERNDKNGHDTILKYLGRWKLNAEKLKEK